MTSVVTPKTGTIEYLGIKIDYDLDKELDDFSLSTLKDRYFWENETHAQEAFARASVFSATYKGVTDFDLAQRLYDYASKRWFMFSTPILSNGGTTRGLPISCVATTPCSTLVEGQHLTVYHMHKGYGPSGSTSTTG